MTTQADQMTHLDTKIELIRLITRRVHASYTGTEIYADSVDLFLGVLNVYEVFLVSQQQNLPVYPKNVELWMQTIADCRFLLDELIENELEMMADWEHGKPPENLAHRMANLLTRIVMELVVEVGKQ
jgi:hypothetical protein